MGTKELLEAKRDKILQLAARYGARNLRVFGSVARGEARPDSDVDILVDIGPECGLEYVQFWQELEELLGRKVDLVTEQGIHPYIRAQVLSEAVPL